MSSLVRRRLLGAAATASLLLPVLSLPLPAQEAPDSSRSSTAGEEGRIRGRVLDRGTGAPLDDALVRLPALDLGMLTNEQGWFDFPSVPLGSHLLSVEFLGYSSRTDTLVLGEGEILDLTISMTVDPIPVEGITIVARPRWLAATGFFRRQERANAYSGHQWSREEIEARNPVFVQDILTTAPGIQLRADHTGRSRVYGRRRCPLAFYLDDVYMPDFNLEALDPDWIEALEVYHGTSNFMPPEYGRKHCGVVLIWLKRGGERPRPDPSPGFR